MAYKIQIGTFKTSGSIDVSSGDIDLNAGAVDNADLTGSITSDKMDEFISEEALDFSVAGKVKFVSSYAVAEAIANSVDAQEVLSLAARTAIQNDVDANELDADAAMASETASRISGDDIATGDRGAIRSEFAAADTAAATFNLNARDAIQTSLTAETARATSAEAANANAIAAITESADVNLDSLVELVTAYELADTNVIASIVTLQADVDQNETDADGSFTSASNDRAAVRSEFAAADTSALNASVAAAAAESTARVAAEAAIQADVDANEVSSDASFSSASSDRAAVRSEFAAADLAALNTSLAAASAEQAIRVAAEAAIQLDVDNNELDADASFASATTDRAAIRSEFAAADVTLTSGLAAETARVDAILLASTADKDSFAEIVTLINSVDTDNDDALAAVIIDLNAEIAATNADILAAATARGVIQADVDANEVSSDASFASASNDRGLIRTQYAAADAALQASLNTEVANIMGDLGLVQADVDGNEADADASFVAASTDRALVRTELAAEATTARAAEAANASAINAEEVRAGIAEVANANAINAEAVRAGAAEVANANAISAEAVTARAAEAANADAITAITAGADVDLDSLLELVTAYELADTNVITSIATLQADVNTNELDGDSDRALIRSQFADADTALIGGASLSGNTLKKLEDRMVAGGQGQASSGDTIVSFAELVSIQPSADAIWSHPNAVVMLGAGNKTIAMPAPAAAYLGYVVKIKSAHAGQSTVTMTAGHLGDDINATSLELDDYAAVNLLCDGSDWWII
jgi:hypothetical protein